MKPVDLVFEQILVFAAILSLIYGFNVLQLPQSAEKPSKVDKATIKLDKLIVMVIDGLRADHMFLTERDLDSDAAVNLKYNEHMPYLSAILNRTQNTPKKSGSGNSSGEALAFEVITALPTVTLPRITSLVSGTVPGFFSMATNFHASTISQDSVIHRMKEKGYRLRLYGDDTWIKMFPKEFDVSDPVTSFFVTDYTEVDYNVTRHLKGLMLDDIMKWDVTVLHYLGLDHIGHTHGSTSEKITDKLTAMDHVIKVLHQGLIGSGSKYGLLVTGDHGMADGGGHGGATYHEIRTSAAFISNNPLHRSIQETYLIRQVDLASTIAGLMGVSVPVTSIGAPINQLLRAVLDTHSLHHFYKYESHRLVDLLKKSGLPYADASGLITEAEWIEAKDVDDLYSAGIVSFDDEKETDRKVKPMTQEVRSKVDRLLSLYEKSCRKASETLVKKVQMYDLSVLLPSAIILALIAFVRLLSTVSHSVRRCPRYLSSKTANNNVRFTIIVCTGCVLLLYLFSCGVSKSHTQMCHPMTSPIALYLILPAVYGLYFATTLYSNIKEALLSGASSMLSKLRHVYFPYSSVSVWWREGNLIRDLLVVGTFCQTLSLLGTSFVEEEHLSFYFLHTSFSVCLLFITCILLLNSLLSDDSPKEKQTENIVDQSSSSNQFESVLLRRNEEVRRKMKAAYDQFGLTSGITATNGGIDEADSKLDSAINKSESVSRKRVAYTIIQKLVLTLLALIVFLSLFRVSRMWISTGDKWKHLPDLEDMIRKQSRFTRQNLLILSGGIALACLKGFRPLVLVCLALSFSETFSRPTTTKRELVMANLSSQMANYSILVIGFIQILVLKWVLGKCKKHQLHNLVFLSLFFLGLETLNSFRKKMLLLKRKSTLLPTRTEMESVDFDKVVDQYGSIHYMLSYFLTFFNTSLGLLWITLQRHDNVLQAALLLLQCEIFMRVIQWLSESGVAGISAKSPLKRLRSHWNSILALAVMWMAQAFYFAMGNSNSLSTIDVSRGFVGSASYHPFLHGFFIYVHTMGAPLYVYLRYMQLLLSSCKDNNGLELFRKISIPSLFHGEGWYGAISSTIVLWWTVRLSVVGLYAVNLVVQRDHLFIWSVFTPKMVYEIAQLFNLVLVHLIMVLIAVFVNW